MIASVSTSSQIRPQTRASNRQLLGITALIAAGSILGFGLPVSAQNIWTGGAGTTNWSTPGNWSFGATPSTGDDVLFDNVILGAGSNIVDNIVDSSFTIAGLDFQTITTNGFHTTLVSPGVSLNINGGSALQSNPLFIGTGADPGADLTLYYKVIGGGTLTATKHAAHLFVSRGKRKKADSRATPDL